MNEKRSTRTPLAGPCFNGTYDQRRAIERWEDAGWTFLHWTEVPRIIAVMEGPLKEVALIDQYGWAWRGPQLDRSKFLPLEKWPPVSSGD